MVVINATLEIPDSELNFDFVRSGGPGGQNVNKVNTRAVLTFDVNGSTVLSDAQKRRLREKLGTRISGEGTLRLSCGIHRTQIANRRTVIERFIAIVAAALVVEKKRRPTRPSRGSVERRLGEKRRASERKQQRRTRGEE